jgi:hypothetical protein
VSLLARQRDHADVAAPSDPADTLYAGAKAGLRPLHEALLGKIRAIGAFDIAPKKGYLDDELRGWLATAYALAE